jgi:hypothetical protein
MGKDKQHGHGYVYAEGTWTMDMGKNMDIDFYWTGALGHNYAKVCT